MIGNLTGQQIVWIIVGIIILLWLISWLINKSKKSTKMATIQPHNLYHYPVYNQLPVSTHAQSNMLQNTAYTLSQSGQIKSGFKRPSFTMSPNGQIKSGFKHPDFTFSPNGQIKSAFKHPDFTMSPNGQIKSGSFTLYYFYSPICGHCKQFYPVWNEVFNKLKHISSLSIHAINGTKPENENLAFYYNIVGFPTVILVTPNKYIVYEGPRNVEDLYKFIILNMNEHQSKSMS